MIVGRRRLLHAALATTTIGFCMPAAPAARSTCSTAPPKPVARGVQTYTAWRDIARDPKRSITSLASLGIDEIELHALVNDSHWNEGEDAGYPFGGRMAEAVAAIRTWGVKVPSALLEEQRPHEPQLLLAKSLGAQYVVVIDWPELETDQLDKALVRATARRWNDLGGLCHRFGLQLCYHNHWSDFRDINGARAFDILAKEVNPDLVMFELDLGWLHIANVDIPQLLYDLRGRVPLIHVKDCSADSSSATPHFVALGDGVIDYGALIPLARQFGVKHVFQETDNPSDPFDTIKRGIAWMNKRPWI
jgi:sugar phosphate isomerase/epimerase